MVEVLIDNIHVKFGGHIYLQTVGIPMGTNCADLVMYSYICKLIWYIYKRVSAMLLNNLKFNDYIDVIYTE